MCVYIYIRIYKCVCVYIYMTARDSLFVMVETLFGMIFQSLYWYFKFGNMWILRFQVAQRVVSTPKGKTYGILSVVSQVSL